MDLFLIAAVFLAAAATFILLGHFARPAPKGEGDARKTFASLPDFDPGEVHAKDGAAISYDPVRNMVTIWDKSGGARLIDPSGVSGSPARSRASRARGWRSPAARSPASPAER